MLSIQPLPAYIRVEHVHVTRVKKNKKKMCETNQSPLHVYLNKTLKEQYIPFRTESAIFLGSKDLRSLENHVLKSFFSAFLL